MIRPFCKMQGAGNDYIFFDCFEESLPHPEALAASLSDRHLSVGGDGIVLIQKSEMCDAKMRMFNADGSEGKMCGNAIRCVGKYLRERRGVKKDVLTVETASGVKTLRRFENGMFSVDMGKPEFRPDRIPALFSKERVIDEELKVEGETVRVTCLSMGNPHCVLFGEYNVLRLGPLLERHDVFPERTNVEFVSVLHEDELSMRVWERGSGETLACGTGACAAAVASVLHGFSRPHVPISIRLKGGTLGVLVGEDGVELYGPAEFAFDGEVEIHDTAR